jgi:formyl-CoA transferase
MIVDVEHPERGTFTTVGCPLVLSDSPVTISSSPLLREHTESILSDLLGMDEREIAEARSAGAV